LFGIELVDNVVAVPHELHFSVDITSRREHAFGGPTRERVVLERDADAVWPLDLAEHAVAVPPIAPVAVGPRLQRLIAIFVVLVADAVRYLETSASAVAPVAAVGRAVDVADGVDRALDDCIGAALANEATSGVVVVELRPARRIHDRRNLVFAAPLGLSRIELVAPGLARGRRRALVAMLREDIGPAIRDGLEDARTREAIGATTRVVTREVMLGMQDAFERIDARHEAGLGLGARAKQPRDEHRHEEAEPDGREEEIVRADLRELLQTGEGRRTP